MKGLKTWNLRHTKWPVRSQRMSAPPVYSPFTLDFPQVWWTAWYMILVWVVGWDMTICHDWARSKRGKRAHRVAKSLLIPCNAPGQCFGGEDRVNLENHALAPQAWPGDMAAFVKAPHIPLLCSEFLPSAACFCSVSFWNPTHPAIEATLTLANQKLHGTSWGESLKPPWICKTQWDIEATLSTRFWKFEKTVLDGAPKNPSHDENTKKPDCTEEAQKKES